jgi:hypothetical protein
MLPQCQTVYEFQPVTAFQVQCEVVYEPQEVTCYQQVWETQTRTCRYTVARPVTQTVEREERYTVLTPVWETQMRDASYNQVRTVSETHYRDEQFTVMRPVWQTENRAQRQRVRRYVTQTVEREVQNVRYEPVTTYRTSVVDKGRYETRQVEKKGWSFSRLVWASADLSADPATVQPRRRWPTLVWAKAPAPTRSVAQRVWQPNPVTVRVPQTSYEKVVDTVKVPTQVGRWVEEEVVHNVPVRVCKMVPEQQTRRVPYTVNRQVTERVERQIPVRVCRYVSQEKVRKVPVTYTRMMYEECVKQVPVRVCKMIPTTRVVCVPRVVRRIVPVTDCRCVPRTVVIQAPAGCGCAGITAPIAAEGTCCGVVAQGGPLVGQAQQVIVDTSAATNDTDDGSSQKPSESTKEPRTQDGWYRAPARPTA